MFVLICFIDKNKNEIKQKNKNFIDRRILDHAFCDFCA